MATRTKLPDDEEYNEQSIRLYQSCRTAASSSWFRSALLVHFIKVNAALARWLAGSCQRHFVPCAAKACSGAASVCTCPTRVAERPDSQGGLSDDAGVTLPARRVCRSRCAQLMGHQIVGVMGSDAHIRAMWVSAPDDQPAACICSSGLICCRRSRRDSLDPDIHWAAHNPHLLARSTTQRQTASKCLISKHN